MLPSFEAFKAKYGVSFHVVSESDRKAMLNPGARSTAFDKALVESTIDQVYQTFLQKVAQGRKMQVEDVDALAQGRVYTGLEALKLGLVDEIGGLQAAFNAAKAAAKFDVAKLYPVLRYEDDTLSLSECLGSPTDMMRCFRRGGTATRLGAAAIDEIARRTSAVDALAAWTGVDAGDTARRARAWLETTRAERALTLWSGYVGVKLQ